MRRIVVISLVLLSNSALASGVIVESITPSKSDIYASVIQPMLIFLGLL